MSKEKEVIVEELKELGINLLNVERKLMELYRKNASVEEVERFLRTIIERGMNVG